MNASPATVLVVDDDAPMRAFVRRNLEARGHVTIEASNGLECLALLRTEHVDLVILDVMMPYLDGYETCRRIRTSSDVPLLVLTAMDDEGDVVTALDCGADDCLTKPFGVEELLARVRSVTRRAQRGPAPGDDPIIEFRGLRIDAGANRAWLDDDELVLTRTELAVLQFFAEHRGKTIPHQHVLRSVWGDGYGSETHYVRVYVNRLRNKLESGGKQFFTTEHGLGYRFG